MYLAFKTPFKVNHVATSNLFIKASMTLMFSFSIRQFVRQYRISRVPKRIFDPEICWGPSMFEGAGYWSRHYQLQVILLRNITHTQTQFSSMIDSPSTRCPFSENKQNHLQQIWETAPINSLEQIQSSSFHGSRSFRWACGRFSSPRRFSSENGRSLMFTHLHSYGIHMTKLDNFDLSPEPTTKKVQQFWKESLPVESWSLQYWVLSWIFAVDQRDTRDIYPINNRCISGQNKRMGSSKHAESCRSTRILLYCRTGFKGSRLDGSS